VALPFGDHLHVHAALDRPSDEHPPEQEVTVVRQI
jgi:hypothetical protein